MYSKTTNDISIKVIPLYSEQNSIPSQNNFVWAYHIEMRNGGNTIVQLLSRYWHITDANGRAREVQGVGVVGEQPILHPNDAYQYTSWVDLPTESGFMDGKYIFQNVDGDRTLLEVEIPSFALDVPHAAYVLN